MQLEIFLTLWGYTASKAQALDEWLEAGLEGLEERYAFALFYSGNFHTRSNPSRASGI